MSDVTYFLNERLLKAITSQIASCDGFADLGIEPGKPCLAIFDLGFGQVFDAS